ncbi:hypothetical protein ACFW3D_26405 [Streptomyces sp. NPDC058864]
MNAALPVDRLCYSIAAAGSDALLVRKDEVVTLTGLSRLTFALTGIVLLRRRRAPPAPWSGQAPATEAR